MARRVVAAVLMAPATVLLGASALEFARRVAGGSWQGATMLAVYGLGLGAHVLGYIALAIAEWCARRRPS
jgi:hypothetical protein